MNIGERQGGVTEFRKAIYPQVLEVCCRLERYKGLIHGIRLVDVHAAKLVQPRRPDVPKGVALESVQRRSVVAKKRSRRKAGLQGIDAKVDVEHFKLRRGGVHPVPQWRVLEAPLVIRHAQD